MRRHSSAIRVGLLVAAMVAGRSAAGQQVGATGAAVWPRVGFDVSVLDRNDAPAKGVVASQLEVAEDGSPVVGATLTPVEGAVSVCLLVDMSGSTFERREVIAREVARLIDVIPAADEICGVDFSNEAYMDAPLAMDRQGMRAWAKTLRSSGGTALRDATTAVAKVMMARSRFASRVIVLISDGGENASGTSEREMFETLRAIGAPRLFVLQNPSRNGDGRDLLERMTGATGGLEFPVRREGDADAAVGRLVEAVGSRCRLEFTSPDPVANATERKLRVQLNKDLRKQRMYVAAPDGYVAAGRK